MLRHMIYVNSSDELGKVLNQLEQSKHIKILKIKNRLGKKLRDLMINYVYAGQIVCELQIKTGDGTVPPLYHGNHAVYEIERLCDSKDRVKLADGLNKLLLYPTNHDQI